MNPPRYSTGLILTAARTTHDNALPRAAQLSRFGVTAAYLQSFREDIEAAEAMPNIGATRIALREKTIEKDELLEAAADWGVDLRMRLAFVYGARSQQAALFPSAAFNVARRSEGMMSQIFESLLQLATDRQEALAEAGQDEAVLADGATLLAALRQANAAQESEKETGMSQTRERWEALNNLVGKINRINQAGRRVFRDDAPNAVLFASKWPSQSHTPEEEPEEITAVASDFGAGAQTVA